MVHMLGENSLKDDFLQLMDALSTIVAKRSQGSVVARYFSKKHMALPAL